MRNKENPDLAQGRFVAGVDRPHLSNDAFVCLGVLIRLSKQAESKAILTSDVKDHPWSFPLATLYDESLIGDPESVVHALDDLERFGFVDSWKPDPDADKCYCLSPIAKKRAGVKTRALILKGVEYEDGKSWENRDRLSVKKQSKEPGKSDDRLPLNLIGLSGPWNASDKVCPYHGPKLPPNTYCLRCDSVRL